MITTGLHTVNGRVETNIRFICSYVCTVQIELYKLSLFWHQ